MKNLFSVIILVIAVSISCSKDDSVTTIPSGSTGGVIDPGSDPNFTIVANSDSGMDSFNRKVVVFGVDVYAASGVEDSKLLYAANIMAQYLDNNEDGTADNQAVVDKMVENRAFLFMWKTEADFPSNPPSDRVGQDLGNDETHPSFVPDGRTGTFDAGLEEVWHIITNAGYERLYPNVFGTQTGSAMSNAMDIARGGQFTTIPNPYPANAWYSYDDQTCDYGCQAGEYIYWTMSSILGAQENRLGDIQHEWKLNTRTLVQSTDPAAYALLTDPQYKFPTVLPDGTYKR